MRQRLYSLRWRMVAATMACMLLIFAGIGLGAHAVARHESEELFSARLATSARVLEAMVAHQLDTATVDKPFEIALPQELEATTSDEPQTFGHRYETKVAFQVWRQDGNLLAKSASAPRSRLGQLKAGFSQTELDGTLWQVFALRSGNVWVLMAEKDEVRQEMAHDIGVSILMPLAVGGLLMLIAVNIVLSRSMRILRALADRIAAREPESLARIELPATPVELKPIVNELNDLLARIKAAFDREQHFINAAAHEIRTPIAGLQLHMENALRADTEAERTKSLDSAMSAVRRTSKLADQLLVLGRISAGSGGERAQRCSLQDICCDVIGEIEPLLTRRGQGIALDASERCWVMGAPEQLARLLQNLIDNASVHGSANGDIHVTLDRHAACAVLRVANDGAPIPAGEIERIFTPYYRVPGSRPSGHGLGLALVKEIAVQHRATVTMHTKANGQGTVVQVEFPVAPALPSAEAGRD